jgi:membrane-associated phospholipid phosphatase
VRYLTVIICIIFICYTNIKANDTVSVNKNLQLFKKSILPISLIGAGIIINNSYFEKQLNEDIQNKLNGNFKTSIDDYLIFIPVAQMYIADIAGIKLQNHWFNQTKYLLISNVVSAGIVYSIKYTFNKARPDGTPYSFPSMHTNLAFVNATVLFNEFKHTSPLTAYSGYLFAVTTGVFRILNNRHYLSDVLTGAGIGILTTELVYYFEPFKKINPFNKTENISFSPVIYKNGLGMYLTYRF